MFTAKKINPGPIPQNDRKTKALLALGLVCFFWGTTWVASRIGVQYMPALQLAGIRQSLGGSIYILYFLFGKNKWPRGKEWMPIFILSMLNFFLTNGLTTWGVQYISAGLGAIIAAIFPLWLLVFALFRRAASIPWKSLVGLLLGFEGVCVIFYEHLKDFLQEGFRFGILISVLASLSWALGTLYTKQQARLFNPYFSIGLQMFISGVLLYTVNGLAGRNIPFNQIPWQSWSAISYLVLIGSVISFMAYLYALQNLPTEQVSIYAYINPVVAVLVSALLFGEKLTILIGLGGLITLYGVYLVNESYRKKPKARV
jgi:drug/metabolite transporter (DMT)-like permease